MQGRDVPTRANLLSLTNSRWGVLKPLSSRRLTVRPVFDISKDRYGTLETGVRAVDNPWWDSAVLVNGIGGTAPNIHSMNGHLIMFEGGKGRTLVQHLTCLVAWRGLRNAQVYG